MRVVFDRPIAEVGVKSALGVKSLFLIGPEPTFNRIRAFENGEWQDIRVALQFIGSLGTGCKLLDASMANYNEFADVFNGFLTAGQTGADEAVRSDLSDEMNRRLSNYLSSMRMFLDFAQFRFKRLHESHAELQVAFKQAQSDLFDSSFEYRFAYKLRNYSQHFGMPIGKVEVSERTVDAEPDPNESTVRVAFSPQDLLAVGGDCWGPVRKDLLERPEDIDVADVMRHVPGLVAGLWAQCLAVEREYIDAAGKVLEAAFQPPDGLEGVPILGEWVDVDGRLGISYEYPPFNVLFRVREAIRAG